MLSQKSKYALRALLALARRPVGEMVLIADIAEQEGLPRKFLEAILLEMARNGLVRSRRGRSGGYTLARGPAEITFGRVVRLMDGALAPVPCVSVNYYQPCADCRDERSCEIRRVMARVREAICSVMDETTLADAMAAPASQAMLAGDLPAL